MAIGVLAYCGETLLHEAVGHGGMCLATGGQVTVLAPLWMRCTVESRVMIAAGPVANILGACLLMAWLSARPPAGPLLRLFLWLFAAFNALVAAGYLCVGGAGGFGDWAALLAGLEPAASWALIWRGALLLAGTLGFYAALLGLAGLYRRLFGPDRAQFPLLARRTLLPAAAAAMVACAAEIAGGRFSPASMGLALGCTLVVGAALTRIGGLALGATSPGASGEAVRFSLAWTAAGLVTAAGFIGVIGPGADLR